MWKPRSSSVGSSSAAGGGASSSDIVGHEVSDEKTRRGLRRAWRGDRRGCFSSLRNDRPCLAKLEAQREGGSASERSRGLGIEVKLSPICLLRLPPPTRAAAARATQTARGLTGGTRNRWAQCSSTTPRRRGARRRRCARADTAACGAPLSGQRARPPSAAQRGPYAETHHAARAAPPAPKTSSLGARGALRRRSRARGERLVVDGRPPAGGKIAASTRASHARWSERAPSLRNREVHPSPQSPLATLARHAQEELTARPAASTTSPW